MTYEKNYGKHIIINKMFIFESTIAGTGSKKKNVEISDKRIIISYTIFWVFYNGFLFLFNCFEKLLF